ncbi:MAG: LysE family translocator [Thermoprotei archaeon]|nr:MAG: LysE family translocator [Thermoprotei archaeon]RLE56840.1 MAG: LysE family translocator [Thermoprotei archaeon]
MSKLLQLILLTIAITPSGALSPGPLTISTIAVGTRGGWRAGLEVAIGHVVVELPYVTTLTILLTTVREYLGKWYVMTPLLAVYIGFITYFSYLLVRDAIRQRRGGEVMSNTAIRGMKPVIIGVVLTGTNIFFLLWWVTVALPVIAAVAELGVAVALPVMYLAHVWLDLLWLPLVAELSRRGAKLLTARYYSYLLLTLAIILIATAAYTVVNYLEIT